MPPNMNDIDKVEYSNPQKILGNIDETESTSVRKSPKYLSRKVGMLPQRSLNIVQQTDGKNTTDIIRVNIHFS